MGGGPAKAIANVTLQAAGALQVAGPVIVLANANNLGSGNLDAIADVDLTGNNVTVADNVVVQAAIAGRVAHSALADANLVLDAASALEINGNVTVAALANLSRGGSVSAHELTELGGSNVTVAGAIDVEALANDGGSGGQWPRRCSMFGQWQLRVSLVNAFPLVASSILVRSRAGPAPTMGAAVLRRAWSTLLLKISGWAKLPAPSTYRPMLITLVVFRRAPAGSRHRPTLIWR